MLTVTAGTIAEVCRGRLVSGDADVVGGGVVVDSREAAVGCIFVALPGENADGHDFVAHALEAGARILVVTAADDALETIVEAAQRRSACVVRVENGLRAVQELASWHRGRLHAAVVGITGSTGKTTTKDFLTSVLSQRMRVVATQGNRNNELGMPLTVLSARSDTDVLVVEMGMRGLGQIARLAEIARPDVGLVTNVGSSHLELLGSQEAVANAKGELVRAIPAGGSVLLNGDDAYSESLALDSAAPVTTYGLGEHCSVRATDISLDAMSRPRFVLSAAAGSIEVFLPVPGRHNVYNALAAAAAALHLGMTIGEVASGLATATVSAMRMETFCAASGVTVINDAYNANPTSMRAALDALSAMAVEGRRIAVLGDMAELGSLSELAHFQLGETAARQQVDVLVTVGKRARRIGDGARAEGMDSELVRVCATADEASEVLDDLLEAGDAVLVKASRVMGLERVVEGIVDPRVR